jgi:hypothetical protein
MSQPTYQQIRTALAKDAYLFRYWSYAIGMVKPAVAVKFRERADEVDRLIGNVKEQTNAQER